MASSHIKITVTAGMRCGLCKEAPVDPKYHRFDQDLEAVVCEDCLHHLRVAQAQMSVKGIKTCTKVRNT
jgi:hypothetical protein